MARCQKNGQWILEVARSFPMPLNCLLLLTATVLVIVFERSADPELGDGGVVARISHYCYAVQLFPLRHPNEEVCRGDPKETNSKPRGQ